MKTEIEVNRLLMLILRMLVSDLKMLARILSMLGYAARIE